MRQSKDRAGSFPTLRGVLGKAGERARGHQALSLVLLLGLAGRPAPAQQPAPPPPPPGKSEMLPPPSDPGKVLPPPTVFGQPGPLEAFPAGPPADGHGAPCAGCGPAGQQNCAVDWYHRPVDLWDVYVRGGVSTMVGHGIEEHLHAGWTIEGGLREPISCPRPNLTFYADFALGYTRNNGDSQFLPTAGSFLAGGPPNPSAAPTVLANFYETKLLNLERSHLQGSLDVDYSPSFLNGRGQRMLHLTARGGARVTDMKAQFFEFQSAELFNLEVSNVIAGQDPRQFVYTTFNRHQDFAFGLFVSGGAAVTFYDVHLLGCGLGDVTLGAEVEYGYDWFDLGSYGRGDQGLGTLTPMISLAVSF